LKIPFVDLKAQYRSIESEIRAAIDSVVSESAFIGGKYLERFEGSFAEFCGTEFAVGVSNGTDALMLALRACGIGSGDEVITVPNTFIATTEAITMVGAKVCFVDVDERSHTMDPARLAEAIGPDTKAIIPVHLFGRVADMDPILDIAAQHGIKVIGDSAQAHGARYKSKPVATLGDVACFSFYPGKNLGAYGDAGGIATDDAEIAAYVQKMRDHGRAEKYTHDAEGFNCRMDGLQASILSAKLAHLAQWSEKRRAIAARYNEFFADVPGIETPPDDEDYESVYHLYVIRVADRDVIKKSLADQGVSSGVHYPIPLHLQPAYGYMGLGRGSFPISERLAGKILSLPVYPELSEEQIEHVVNSVKSALG
jgi:dTDP-4-amino-4,6-dideoxygalactose transaminase